MIICNCNIISDKDFKRVAKLNNCSVDDCFTALNQTPNCRKCFNNIEQIIKAVQSKPTIKSH